MQTVLRHAHVTTTQRYVAPDVETLFDRMQEHYRRPRVERAYPAGYELNTGYVGLMKGRLLQAAQHGSEARKEAA